MTITHDAFDLTKQEPPKHVKIWSMWTSLYTDPFQTCPSHCRPTEILLYLSISISNVHTFIDFQFTIEAAHLVVKQT